MGRVIENKMEVEMGLEGTGIDERTRLARNVHLSVRSSDISSISWRYRWRPLECQNEVYRLLHLRGRALKTKTPNSQRSKSK
jgi:hypothetical protein